MNPSEQLLQSTASGGHAEEDRDVFNARMQFLFTALVSSLLAALCGMAVFYQTNSLTVQIDTFSAGADFLSVLCNILIEVAKASTHGEQRILALDLVGACLSLLMLLGVAVFGVIHAKMRSDTPYSLESHVGSFKPMLAYNFVTLASGIVTLSVWYKLSSRMNRSQGNHQDWMNVLSGLVHILVDFVGNMVLICTTCWLLYVSSKPEDHWTRTPQLVRGDVFGSLLLCVCVTTSAVIMIVQSIETLRRLAAVAEFSDPELAKACSASSEVAEKYGAVNTAS